MKKLHYFLYNEIEYMYYVTMKEKPLEFHLYFFVPRGQTRERPTSLHSRQFHSTASEGLRPSKSP